MANLTYKCPECRAELVYSIEYQNWTCEYCDGQFTLEQLEASTDAAKIETLQENIQRARELDHDDVRSIQTDDDSDYGVKIENRDLVGYSCSHCQAEIITSRTTSATICPYCQHPVVIKNALVNEFSPELVIPFQVTREASDEAFRKFMRKPLTPNAFYREVVVNKVQGIYVPFWLFDGDATGKLQCTGILDKSDSEYEIEEVYDCTRECEIAFEGVCVDASKKIGDAAMDSIEPFDLTQAKVFNPAYLSGYLAERYDETIAETFPRCKQRVGGSAFQFCNKDIRMRTSNFNFSGNVTQKRVRYVLLPTWILHCTYKDEDYLFAMNGQTGKFVGNLPLSPLKTFFAGLVGAICGFSLGLLVVLMEIM